MLRDGGTGCRVSGNNDHQRFFVLRPSADFAQEPHGGRRVREGGKACLVQCRQQQPASKAGAFRDVVVLRPAVLFDPALALREADDQPRRDLKKPLVLVRAERGEGGEPFRRRLAGIERALLLLGGEADGVLLVRR